jgi:hypothetical protein
MSLRLTITYGSTTIDLHDRISYAVRDGFYPDTPASLTEPTSDQVDILIRGSSHDDLAEKIRAINRAFEWARRHKTGPDGVYLNFAINESLDAWRSRITDGELHLDSGLTRRWREYKALASLIIERVPYWEGPEAQLAVSNPLGTSNTSGLTVYNPRLHCQGKTISFDSVAHKISDSANGLADFLTGMAVTVEGSTSNDGAYTITDGGHSGYFVVAEAIQDESAGADIGISGPVCNFVAIAEGDVEGDLPGAARLEITNNFFSAFRAYTIWIGQNVESDPENYEHILEAENASGGNTTNLYTASGNQYKKCDWEGAAETALLTWELSTPLLTKLSGRYIRIISRYPVAAPTGLCLRVTVKMSATPLWEGPLVLSGTGQIQELVSLRLPPYLLGAGNLYPLNLVLSAKIDTAEAHSCGLDYLQLTPLDGWRKLHPKCYGLDFGVRLVDDGIDGYLYSDGWTSEGKLGQYIGFGESILLHPGKVQRLYFLHQHMEHSTQKAPINRTLSVKVYYRPRRMTV